MKRGCEGVRAQRIHAWGGPLVYEEMAVPEPGPGEALVRVAACGVGLTVQNCINGDLGTRPEDLPRVPGHEFTGTVEAVGPGVTALAPGDRVMAYFYLSCDECQMCQSAHEPLCENFGGFVGVARDGGYAEYACLPARNLLPLPDAVPFVAGTAIPDAIATPFHVCNQRAEVRPGERVVVIGAAGGVGAHMVQMARLFGGTVSAVDVKQETFPALQDLGAEAVYDFRTTPPEAILDAMQGKGAEVVIDLVGRRETLQWAARVVAPRGRLVLLTTFRDVDMTVMPRDLVLREVSVVGSRYASKWEVRQAAELVVRGRIRPVISQETSLAEVGRLHAALMDGTLFGRGAIRYEVGA
jgi:D-arabinose 1-dehydrogenase-like Zn-dependent alcohol dehydrogenase